MITENRNIAIAYDFDGTLAPGNMQEYNFIPDINMEKKAFWKEANELAKKHDMDEVLAYMHLMLMKAKEQNLDIREETFMEYGKKISLFKGVESYFERINKYAESKNLHLEHFIISSGLREIIKGTSIAKYFKTIYASGFQYDDNGIACWPALGVNYTNKTQYLFRINKGIYNSYDNTSINKAMPENMRAVPFSNLIYIGDGETDVPAMKMVNLYGGTTIAVYNPDSVPTPERPITAKENCINIIRQKRADYIGPANYTEGGELDFILKKIIDKIAVEQDLLNIKYKEISQNDKQEQPMITDIYQKYLQSSKICTDSRNLEQNCMFVCLKGANFDGNRFAKDVLDKGAAFVITDNRELAGDQRAIIVDDTLKTLQDLANYHRRQLDIPVIGITGTNGKTTTKELVNTVLSAKYKTYCTQGNLNNHIGVPLTLLSIKKDAEIAIVEMGANHPGEIDDLCKIAEPNYGLITNIGIAHIEGFGSKENIINTKKALYRHVIKNNGILFVNESDSVLRENLDYQNVIFYGKNAENNIVDMDPFLTIKIGEETIKTNLTGNYNIMNFLAAAAVGSFFKVPENLISKSLAEYVPSNHRSQVNRIGSNIIISDYYNANLTSMSAAIRNLSQLNHSHKVAILGDMLELGELSETAHREILKMTEEAGIETYFVGKEFAKVTSKNTFPDVEHADDYFKSHPLNNAMVLIKGSNSVHLNKLQSILQ